MSTQQAQFIQQLNVSFVKVVMKLSVVATAHLAVMIISSCTAVPIRVGRQDSSLRNSAVAQAMVKRDANNSDQNQAGKCCVL